MTTCSVGSIRFVYKQLPLRTANARQVHLLHERVQCSACAQFSRQTEDALALAREYTLSGVGEYVDARRRPQKRLLPNGIQLCYRSKSNSISSAVSESSAIGSRELNSGFCEKRREPSGVESVELLFPPREDKRFEFNPMCWYEDYSREYLNEKQGEQLIDGCLNRRRLASQKWIKLNSQFSAAA